jgi:hypothetical protein
MKNNPMTPIIIIPSGISCSFFIVLNRFCDKKFSNVYFLRAVKFLYVNYFEIGLAINQERILLLSSLENLIVV